MTVKSFVNRHLGRKVFLGRKHPKFRGRQIRPLRPTAKLPTPAAAVDWSAAVHAKGMTAIFLNDQLGDCVEAAISRIVAILTANVGKELDLTDAEVTALYGEMGGYVPGDASTDNGTDEQTALADWLMNGAPIGTPGILDWLAVDPQQPAQYRLCIERFGHLLYGVDLPDAWIVGATPGGTWDVGTPDPTNGHAFPAYGYGSAGTLIDTWGIYPITMTDKAHAGDVGSGSGGELYVTFNQLWWDQQSGMSPAGHHWNEDVSLWAQMGGKTLPQFGPTPTPVPPVPVPPIPPVPPVPVPPIPVPPTPSVKAIVDQLFADLEAGLSTRPLLMGIVIAIQAMADQWLIAHGYAKKG